MRILLVAPLKRKITPRITAARPRIVFDIAAGLIKKGHRVSVLGTGDSKIPKAKVIAVTTKSMVDMPNPENPFYLETGYLVKLAKKLEMLGNKFDVVHNHTYPEFINLLVVDKLKIPVLTTIHAQMTPELDETLAQFNSVKNCFFIALSKAHQKLAKKTKIWKIIYNGIDTKLYKFRPQKSDYLLWLVIFTNLERCISRK